MDNTFEDFKEDFISQYPNEDFTKIDEMIDGCFENNYYTESYKLKHLDNWDCYLEIEKHNALNFTYEIYFIKEFEDKDAYEISVSFYTGVDVGCECVHYGLEGETLPSTRTERHLVDIKLDENKVMNFLNSQNKTNIPIQFLLKAEIVLSNFKEYILDIYRKQDYDNYMTGGGTTKTDEYYKKLKQELNEKGVFWECVYEDVDVDRNLR